MAERRTKAAPVRAMRAVAPVLVVALSATAWYGLTGPSGWTALAAMALTAGLAAGARAAMLAYGAQLTRLVTAVPLLGRATGMRERACCARFLRQRDPDAAGRVRPRAPSAAPAAA